MTLTHDTEQATMPSGSRGYLCVSSMVHAADRCGAQAWQGMASMGNERTEPANEPVVIRCA
ncbi:MAG: hypothetical protein E6J34_18565 [Chloroflexi bacterium]|nr:MAG: hypothetical protein E6J34_18565 [Chloroflexota bacterium]